ncbi:MAG: cellulose synthase [Streptosporangiales bacterium]|nr:cellulose synthase [Streptosporangiales bacterium]
MDNYGEVLWLPVCAGLTGIGVLLSILVWRRRGAASGLRLISWSLLPIGLYLMGLLSIVVPFGVDLISWVTRAAFSLTAWIGVAVIGLAVVLWVISGVMLGRRRVAAGEDGKAVESGEAADTKQVAASDQPAEEDEGIGDIEEILRRRGIE